MSRDSRLSVALHLLLHIGEADAPLTSEALGPRMDLNPVVVRRTMAGLREAGIVRSVKGHGGGWSLARPLEAVSLADVYEALGSKSLFGIGLRDEAPRCGLEQAANRVISAALAEAEAQVMAKLRGTSVASLVHEAKNHERPPKRAGKRSTAPCTT
jgi:Rrf2 family protein